MAPRCQNSTNLPSDIPRHQINSWMRLYLKLVAQFQYEGWLPTRPLCPTEFAGSFLSFPSSGEAGHRGTTTKPSGREHIPLDGKNQPFFANSDDITGPQTVKQAWRLLCSPLPGTHFHRSTHPPYSKEPGRSWVLHAGLGSKLRNHGKADGRREGSGASSCAAETSEALQRVKNTTWLPLSGQIRGMIYVKQGNVSSCESLGFYGERVISWVQFWFVFCVCA